MTRVVAVVGLWLGCQPALASGVLKVTSKPAGATIEIDGKKVGRAPFSVRLSPGQHTVKGTARKHDSQTRIVQIQDRKITEVNIVLEPSPIDIIVKCGVESAVVYVEGVEAGPVNKVVRVRPGVREFAVVAEGYNDSVFHARVPWQGPKTFKAQLARGISFRSGTIALEADSWHNLRPSEASWQFVNGHALFAEGNMAWVRYKGRPLERNHAFAMMCRFRAKNVDQVSITASGVIYGVDKKAQDGRWHTILVEVAGRKARKSLDGTMERFGAATVSESVDILLQAQAPGNNDPYFMEIGSLTVKQFGTAEEMAAALGTTAIK